MRKNIENIVRLLAPPGILDERDIVEVANDALLMMMRGPNYIRMALGVFYGFPLPWSGHVKIIRFLERTRGKGWIRRARHWMLSGLVISVNVCIYSHPKVMSALGIGEGGPPQPSASQEDVRDIAYSFDSAEIPLEGVEVDVVVVGTGPGGAMAALELARAEMQVLVCEKGGRPLSADDTVSQAALHYYGYGGLFAAFGLGPQTIPMMVGETLGGTAHINMGTCLRPSDELLRSWGFGAGEFSEYFTRVEAFLDVRLAKRELLGRQNEIMEQGCKNLGMSVELIPRNAVNYSKRSGNIIGMNAQKLSPERALLPEAFNAGAHVVTDCLVDRVIVKNGSAIGVVVHCRGRKVMIRARNAVVIAAGTIQSPLLLRSSGIRNKFLGKASFMQLNSSLIGIMDDDVESNVGIEQGMLSREHADRGIVFEAVSTPPALVVPYIYGLGPEIWESMRHFKKFAQIGFIADLNRSPMGIRSFFGDPFVSFRIDKGDAEAMRFAFKKTAEILFAGGARRVLIPGRRKWCVTFEEARQLVDGLSDTDLHAASLHTIGTCRLGSSKKNSVVNHDGLVHGTRNLYVMDGSVLPSSLGVNPQLTISAMASRNARRLAEIVLSSPRFKAHTSYDRP